MITIPRLNENEKTIAKKIIEDHGECHNLDCSLCVLSRMGYRYNHRAIFNEDQANQPKKYFKLKEEWFKKALGIPWEQEDL